MIADMPSNKKLNSAVTELFRKFQTNKNFNELHLIIHQILDLKIS